jgi:GNAT superfamily N-acetyltransferase
MEFRRLAQQEHGRTRSLYEQVFSEDSQSFVDYYYKWKTKDNDIYVAEDADGIHAMVHLNPFQVSVEGQVQTLHYIVAVATQPEYRHRGLMRQLLALAEREMAERGETLTFLMPASEQIYLPFGYRFFGWQKRGILRAGDHVVRNLVEGNHVERSHMEIDYVESDHAGKYQKSDAGSPLEKSTSGIQDVSVSDMDANEKISAYGNVICRPVRVQEYGSLSQFVNETLARRYEVFVYRDASYYERLCAEQKCQGGEVMVIVQEASAQMTTMNHADASASSVTVKLADTQCHSGISGDLEMSDRMEETRIIGTFCTAEEEDSAYVQELREIIFSEEAQAEAGNALQAYVDRIGDCKVAGCPEELKLSQEELVPLMMGKVPSGGIFESMWDENCVFLNEVV